MSTPPGTDDFTLPTPDQPSSNPLLPLTSDSLRPFNSHGPIKGVSSVASSSEAHDLVGPLPPSRPNVKERSSHRASRQCDLPKIPLPSPPALGLSDLMSGSPNTPSTEGSYFVSQHGESQRRYSPFRTYYGDVPKCSSDVAESSAARSEASSSGSRKSPHVQNQGVLAPHGSFTTMSRPPRRPRSEGPVSDSQLYVGNLRQGPAEDGRRAALEAAARKGDQLAMYRLGWRADTITGPRHHLGNIEDVWGLSLP